MCSSDLQDVYQFLETRTQACLEAGIAKENIIWDMGFGFGKTVQHLSLIHILIVAAILFFLDTFTNFEQTDWWKESKLIPHFGFIIEWFFQQLQASSSFLNSTFKPVSYTHLKLSKMMARKHNLVKLESFGLKVNKSCVVIGNVLKLSLIHI